MRSDPDSGSTAVFRRGVDALCLSREDIARELGITEGMLERFAAGADPVPPITQLKLVDVLKDHEARLGGAAGLLYEEAMLRLQASSADPVLFRRPRSPRGTPPES